MIIRSVCNDFLVDIVSIQKVYFNHIFKQSAYILQVSLVEEILSTRHFYEMLNRSILMRCSGQEPHPLGPKEQAITEVPIHCNYLDVWKAQLM